MYKSLFDIRLIAFVLIFLFIIITSPNYTKIVCPAEGESCTLYSNSLGIKRTETFLSPEYIKAFDVEYRKKSVYRSSSPSRSYNLVIITPNKTRHELFTYRNRQSAIATGERLINCLSNKNYPCEISKY